MRKANVRKMRKTRRIKRNMKKVRIGVKRERIQKSD